MTKINGAVAGPVLPQGDSKKTQGVPAEKYPADAVGFRTKYKKFDTRANSLYEMLGDRAIELAERNSTEIPKQFKDSPVKRLKSIGSAISNSLPAQAVVGAILTISLYALIG